MTYFVTAVSALACLSFSAVPAAGQALPEGPGKQELVKTCGACHVAESTSRELARRQSRDAWSKVLFRMREFGAEMTNEEQDLILAYLANHFGLGTPIKVPAKININKATAKELEAGLALTELEAEAIVQHRLKHGEFKVLKDVTAIKGLDSKKIEAAKDRIVMADQAPAGKS